MKVSVDNPVPEQSIVPEALPTLLKSRDTPLVLRGLTRHWPAVQQESAQGHLLDYLRRFYQDATVTVFRADASENGRYFYNDTLTGFNFRQSRESLSSVFDELQTASLHQAVASLYVGSTTLDRCLPGFRQHNPLDFGGLDPLASIWLGNQSRIAAHYDVPDNLACVVAGRRRFTLFPPEQLANLYVGPLELTPAGQAISLVDFHHYDDQRFPHFRTALAHAMSVTLEPGDAIFIPSMWWHHVESLDNLNVLINYWWRDVPAWMGTPVTAMMHALLSVRDLPASQKKAWRAHFEHYVFGNEHHEHIPAEVKGALQSLDESTARQLRSQILNRLNR